MYYDVDFADGFRYQLTMYEAYILIGLSRLLDTHIAYEIVIKKKSPQAAGMMRETISHIGLE